MDKTFSFRKEEFDGPIRVEIQRILSETCRTPVELRLRSFGDISTLETNAAGNGAPLIVDYLFQGENSFRLLMNRLFLFFLVDRQLGFQLPYDRIDAGPKKLSDTEKTIIIHILNDLKKIETIVSGQELPLLSCQVSENNVFSEKKVFWGALYDVTVETCMTTFTVLFSRKELESCEGGARHPEGVVRQFRPETESLLKKEAGFLKSTPTNTEICVKIGTIEMDPKKISDLKIGDTLKTDLPAEILFTIELDGEPKFHGRPGLYQGKMAIQLEDPVV